MRRSHIAFKDHRVRVVDIEGKPWFVAADVCRALDLRGYPSQHTAKLSEDNKKVLSHATNTRLPIFNKKQYTATVITESGLYDLVFLSRKPDAEEFKTWVTRDVLPAIRKDGASLTSRLRRVRSESNRRSTFRPNVA